MQKRRSRAMAVMVLFSMLMSPFINLSMAPHFLLAEEQDISNAADDVEDPQVGGSLEGGQADEMPAPENPAQKEEVDAGDVEESVSESDGTQDQPGDDQPSESEGEEQPSTENADDAPKNDDPETDGEASKAEGPITLISGSGISLMSVEIEGNTYDNLSDALNAAKNGDTLFISDEVVVDNDYSISGKGITIQLSEGGALVNQGNNAVTLTVENGAALTLKGPGTIKNIHFLVNGSTFNLAGGVHVTSEKSGSIIKFNGGVGSLNGSAIDVGGNTSSTSRLLDITGGAKISTISGMTFTGGQACVCAHDSNIGSIISSTLICTSENATDESSSALLMVNSTLNDISDSKFTVSYKTYTDNNPKQISGTAGISLQGSNNQMSTIGSITDSTIEGISGIYLENSSIGSISGDPINSKSSILGTRSAGIRFWQFQSSPLLKSTITSISNTRIHSDGSDSDSMPHGIVFWGQADGGIDEIAYCEISGKYGIHLNYNYINRIKDSTISGRHVGLNVHSGGSIQEVVNCKCIATSNDFNITSIGLDNSGKIESIRDSYCAGIGAVSATCYGLKNIGEIDTISNTEFEGMYPLRNENVSIGEDQNLVPGYIKIISDSRFISNGQEQLSWPPGSGTVPGAYALWNKSSIGTIEKSVFDGNSAIYLDGEAASIDTIRSGIFMARKYDCFDANAVINTSIELEPGLSETKKQIGDSRFYAPSGKNIFSDLLENKIVFPTYDNSEAPGEKLNYFISDPEDTDNNVPGYEDTGFRFLRRQLRVVYCNTNEEGGNQVCVFGKFFEPGSTVTLLTKSEAADLNDAFKDREGFEFKGWTDENGTLYDFGQELTDQRHDLTLYAHWEPGPKPEVATITFDPNGGIFEGSTEPTSYTYAIGDVITIPAGPTHDYLEFSHWEGSKYYPGQKYTVTGSHTFTAKWKNPGIIRVNKVWMDANNQDGLRPSSVTFRLFSDDEDTGRTLTLTAGDQWTGWFTELDRYKEDGTRIQYSLKEDAVPGYESNIEGNDWSGFTVTNSRVSDSMAIEGHKTWNDNNNEAGARPESITIRLLKNGEEIDTRTVSEADNWGWNFGDLPRFENGQKIDYSIREDAVEGYTSEVRGFDVINHYGSEPTEPTTEEPTEKPTQPSEPTEPTEPSEPTEPTEPTESTEPTQPTQPTEPSGQPTEPSAPEQSKPSATTEPGLPQTGEQNGPYIWLGSLLLLAGIGLIVLRRRMRGSRN